MAWCCRDRLARQVEPNQSEPATTTSVGSAGCYRAQRAHRQPSTPVRTTHRRSSARCGSPAPSLPAAPPAALPPAQQPQTAWCGPQLGLHSRQRVRPVLKRAKPVPPCREAGQARCLIQATLHHHCSPPAQPHANHQPACKSSPRRLGWKALPAATKSVSFAGSAFLAFSCGTNVFACSSVSASAVPSLQVIWEKLTIRQSGGADGRVGLRCGQKMRCLPRACSAAAQTTRLRIQATPPFNCLHQRTAKAPQRTCPSGSGAAGLPRPSAARVVAPSESWRWCPGSLQQGGFKHQGGAAGAQASRKFHAPSTE